MRWKTTFIVGIISLMISKGYSQDIYLSHHEAAPQYLNPALTGMYFGERLDYRMNVNYSTQSVGSFTNMFNTAAVGYDRKIGRFGVGGYVINSQAGVTNYNKINFLLSGAYEISIDPMYKHNLLTGIQAGIFNTSVNKSKLLFENQYSPVLGGFDAALDNGESMETTSLLRFDAGLGAFYKYQDRRKPFNPFIGLSFFHATNPKVSFYNQDITYPVRITIYSGWGFNFNQYIQITPKAFYMQQGSLKFLDIGAFGYYMLKNERTEFIFGLLYNSNDIFTAHTGLKFNNTVYRLSYGFNSFFQDKFNGSRNDVEFSVILSRKTNSNPSY